MKKKSTLNQSRIDTGKRKISLGKRALKQMRNNI